MFRYAVQIWDSPNDEIGTIHYLLLDEDLNTLNRVLREWEQAGVIDSWKVVRASDNAILAHRGCLVLWVPCTDHLSAFLGSKESTERIKRYEDWLEGQETPYSDAESAFVSRRNY